VPLHRSDNTAHSPRNTLKDALKARATSYAHDMDHVVIVSDKNHARGSSGLLHIYTC
jgi:hypothetical protein